MGLDMYLVAKRYLSKYDDDDAALKSNLKNFVKPPASMDIYEVCANAMYWRKANSIHEWFVKHVQNDDDNCQEYYVSRENLKELASDINKVIEDNSLAEYILPTAEGFFFGSVSYDDSYFKTLKETHSRIEQLLKEVDDNWEFYYQASW